MKNTFSFLLLTFLLFFASSLYAQELKVQGRVSNSENQPVVGATVVLKGTSNGTTTNSNGDFRISVPKAGSILVVSFVGMGAKEITIQNNNFLNVALFDVTQLDDVVVTALGIKRSEKALGYSVQKVDGDILQKVAGTNVMTSLTGKASGLLVKNPSDFAVNPELTIRGESPLLVIDGIAYANKTLSDLSSDDIESLNILKGPTASALYGFRGASGVVLVTTKNGSALKKGLTVDLNCNTMFTAGYLAIPEKQGVYGRGSDNVYDINSMLSWGVKMDGRILNQWDPYKKVFRDYEYLPIGKDNFKNFLENGLVTNRNVSVSYRENHTAVRSSFNWTETKGQYPNQLLDKYTYTLGGDINLKKFHLASNMAYTHRHSPNMGSNGYTSYDPMYNLLIHSAADYDIRDYKNNYWLKKGEVQNFTYQSELNNPYFDAYEKTNEVTHDIFNADLSMDYNIAKWLKFMARGGVDFFTDKGVQRVSKGSYVSTGNTPIPGNPWTWNGYQTGAYNTGRTQGLSINSDFILTGNTSFDKFNLEYMAGSTIFYNNDNTMYAMTQNGISIPGFFSLKASVDPVVADETESKRQVNSLYGRTAISWNNMIYAEATGRNDWSSTQVNTPHKSYFYPSVSGSFVISELLPNTRNWLDLLKVRTSWTMSKQPAGIYETNSVYTIYTSIWGSSVNGASAPAALYSSDLKPETSKTNELGLQGIFLRNRAAFDLTYYDKRISDILEFNAPLSTTTGYTSMATNTNEIRSTRGWELTLSGSPIKNKIWRWDMGLNWSKYATYYVKLDDIYTPKEPWIKKGERVDYFVSKNFQYDPNGNVIVSNGRLIPSQYDSKFGNVMPNFVWGFNTTLKYRDFSLYMAFDGVVGGLMNTRTESYMWQTGVHPKSANVDRTKPYVIKGVKVVSGTAEYDQYGNITKDTRVFEPNDVETTYQQYITDLHGSSAWGGNGTWDDTYSKTFFKMRELSLVYNIPSRYLNKVWIKDASVAFVGQNVFLWAKDFKYSDPDGGSEDFADPAVRNLGFNVKLSF